MKQIVVIFLLLLNSTLSVQAEENLFISNAYYGIDMNKAKYSAIKTAMRLWAKKMSKEVKGAYGKTTFYADFNDLKKDIKNKKVDTIMLSTYSYAMHSDFLKKEFNDGWIMSEADGKPFYRYVIIKRRDGKLKKEHIVHYYYYSNISKQIAQKYAFKHDLNFNYRTTTKRSKPVLDLFFNKCDIAIVTDYTWKLMKELNPQLSQTLVVIDKTDRVFTNIISLFANKITDEKKRLYLKAVNMITTTESGKQFMKMFQFNKLLYIKNAQLGGLEKFYKDYLKLKKKHE